MKIGFPFFCIFTLTYFNHSSTEPLSPSMWQNRPFYIKTISLYWKYSLCIIIAWQDLFQLSREGTPCDPPRSSHLGPHRSASSCSSHRHWTTSQGFTSTITVIVGLHHHHHRLPHPLQAMWSQTNNRLRVFSVGVTADREDEIKYLQ